MRKKFLVISLLLLMLANVFSIPTFADEGGIAIDETNFPDEEFRHFVKYNLDTDKDGSLSKQECEKVTEIKCVSKDVKNFKGISNFPHLKRFECSKNSRGYQNASPLFDLSDNVELTELICKECQLGNIDLSKNINLELLDISSSTDINNLDLTKLTKLKELNVSGVSIYKFDVSQNVELEKLYCYGTVRYKELDVRKNTKLKVLDCSDNQLTYIDLKQLKNLEELYCSSNKFSELNLNSNEKLRILKSDACDLESLDLSKNVELEELEIDANELRNLDLQALTKLKKIDCSSNILKSIDLSNSKDLEELICNKNKLTKINVKDNKKLKKLDLFYNLLNELILPDAPDLEYLRCSHNKLRMLDVSKNTNLKELDCSRNQLTSIDLKFNNKIKNFDADYNDSEIFINNDRTFDLTSLSENFDVSKASNFQGGVVNGNILTVEEGKNRVTYKYDCGQGKTATFRLIPKPMPKVQPISVNVKVLNKTAKRGIYKDNGNNCIIPDPANKDEIFNSTITLRDGENVLDVLRKAFAEADKEITYTSNSEKTGFSSINGLDEGIGIATQVEENGQIVDRDMSRWINTINGETSKISLAKMKNMESPIEGFLKLEDGDEIYIYYTVDGTELFKKYNQTLEIDKNYETIDINVGESYTIPFDALKAGPSNWAKAKKYKEWTFKLMYSALGSVKVEENGIKIEATEPGKTELNIKLPNRVERSITLNITKVDKAELEKALKAAEEAKKNVKTSADGKDVDPTDKWTTSDEVKALEAAISDAKKVDEDANAKQEAVNKAKADLEKATKKFTDSLKAGMKEAKADKAELEKAIKVAEDAKKNVKISADGKDIDPSDKWTTTEEMKALEAAISEAKKVDEDANAKQEAVNKVKADLENATKKFTDSLKDGIKEEPKVDKSELEKALKAAEEAKKNVKTSADGKDVDPTDKWTTSDEVKALEAAISDAKKVDEDANAKQEAVNKAKADLEKATKKFTDSLKAGMKVQPPTPENPEDNYLKVVTEGQNDNSVKTEGNKIIYTIGISTKAVYRIVADGLKTEDLSSVLLDGYLVDGKNYDVKPGSIIVSFKKAYVDSLATGTHKITFKTSKGDAEAELVVMQKEKATVEDSKSGKNTAKTGDTTNALGYAGLAIAVLGAVYVIDRRKKTIS